MKHALSHRARRLPAAPFIAAITATAAFTAACGDNGDGSALGAAQCNPLGGAPLACIAPWPSSIYLADDTTSATGKRLDIPDGAFPATVEDTAFVPGALNTRSGFSPASQIFTVFPELVDASNAATSHTIEASLEADSPTVIIDMSTGERVAHWVEIDANTQTAGEQALYLRPAMRLKGGTRYAVAIRNTLRAQGGGALTVPAGFAALRDDTSGGADLGHARLARVAATFGEVFDALAAAGVAKDDLVVAWDFVTADDASLGRDMLSARDATLAAIGDGADLNVSVTATADPNPGIAYSLRIDYDVPNFLNPAGGIYRNADGAPMIDGTYTARGYAIIPDCNVKGEVPIVLYGHGFFGSPNEINTWDAIRHYASAYCTIIVAAPWTGMTSDDVPVAVTALSNLSNAPAFAERILQGMMNFVTLETLLRGKLTADELSPRLAANADDLSFWGISQGHILGATFFSYSPTIERGVLHVGGGGWGLIFERAFYWKQYSSIIGSYYAGPLGIIIAEQVLQLAFDPVDSIHAVPGGVNAAIPGTPTKAILQQMSVGDSAVTNQASLYQARTAGLPLMTPSVDTDGFALEITGSSLAPTRALAIYDEAKTPLPPDSNLLHDTDNGAHTAIVRRSATQQQIATFLSTGTIVNYCMEDGAIETACHCDQGYCGDTFDAP